MFSVSPGALWNEVDFSSYSGAIPVSHCPAQGGGASAPTGWFQVPREGGACEGASNHLLEPGLVLESTSTSNIPPAPQPLGLPAQEQRLEKGVGS